MKTASHAPTKKFLATLVGVALVTAACSSAANSGSDSRSSSGHSGSSAISSAGTSTESTPTAGTQPQTSGQSAGKFTLVNAGTLTVPYSPGPPTALVDNSNQVVGIMPDILRGFARANGLKITFVNSSFAGTITAIQTGTGDISGGVFYNEDRAKQELFTKPYMLSGSFMAIKKGSGYTTPASLKGHKVGVVAGFAQVSYMKKIVGDGNVLEYPGAAEGMQALRTGRIVGFVSGGSITYSVNQDPTLEAVSQADSSWGMPPSITEATDNMFVSCHNEALADAVDGYIDSLVASGEFKKIVLKYADNALLIANPQTPKNLCP